MKVEDIINITESFDSCFSQLSWVRNDTTISGIGVINGEQFILEIGLQSITLEQKTFRYVTIEFYKIVNGVPTQNTSQSIIFGCIKNAFYAKIEQLDRQFGIDAVVTLVKTDVDNKPEKRVSLYKNMFSKIQGNTQWNWIHDFKFKNLLGSIFTKHEINIDTLNQLRQSISNRRKQNL